MSGSDNYPGKPSLDDWERLSATKPAVDDATIDAGLAAILAKSDDEIMAEELFQLLGKADEDSLFSRDEVFKAMHYSFGQGGHLIKMLREAERQAAARPVAVEGDELVEQLRQPKKWCCIFEHEGQMRHGETDAPFKAANLIESLSRRMGDYERALRGIAGAIRLGAATDAQAWADLANACQVEALAALQGHSSSREEANPGEKQ